MATNQTMDHVLVTDDNHGPILAICTWFMVTVMVLAVIARVTIKVAVRRELKVEDFSVMAALVSLQRCTSPSGLFTDIGSAIWSCTNHCGICGYTKWFRTTRSKSQFSELNQY
jgi:hypothetical protein